MKLFYDLGVDFIKLLEEADFIDGLNPVLRCQEVRPQVVDHREISPLDNGR